MPSDSPRERVFLSFFCFFPYFLKYPLLLKTVSPESKTGKVIFFFQCCLGSEGMFFFQVGPMKNSPLSPGECVLAGIGLPDRFEAMPVYESLLVLHGQDFGFHVSRISFVDSCIQRKAQDQFFRGNHGNQFLYVFIQPAVGGDGSGIGTGSGGFIVTHNDFIVAEFREFSRS